MRKITAVRYCTLVASIWCLPSCANAEQVVADDLQAISDQVRATLPNGSLLLATCGPSDGRGYYVEPKESGWQDDPISKGRTVFVVGPDGKPNVLFKDAFGAFVNAIKDGATVSFSFIDEENGSFGMIETYPNTGVTQTYAVVMDSEGNRTMLWTTVKANVSAVNITKVAAFVSRCL